MNSLSPRTERNQGSSGGWGWPGKRRQFRQLVIYDDRLTDGCKTWLGALAGRSDDRLGKVVYGRQTRQAADIGRSERSVRSYRQEAEALGYVKTYRARLTRGPDGCRRRATNRYYLCVPSAAAGDVPAPRRRQRAGYCVVRAHKSCSSLPATDRRFNPEGVLQPPPHPRSGPAIGGEERPDRQIPPADLARIRAEMRQRLGPRRR
jgi:hypothetical protein